MATIVDNSEYLFQQWKCIKCGKQKKVYFVVKKKLIKDIIENLCEDCYKESIKE